MDIKVFDDALAHRHVLDEQFHDRGRKLSADFTAGVLELAKKQFPNRRFNAHPTAVEALGDVGKEMLATVQLCINDVEVERKAALKAMDERLEVLAMVTDVPTFDTLRLVSVSRASSWSSQTQSNKYAEVHAENKADLARALNLRVEVRATELHQIGGRYPHQLIDYGVFCNTSQVGWEVVYRKAADLVPLREWVRRCWKRGANPRVYNPYLPHNFEEKNGLDYFGGDLRAKAAKAAETAS